MFSLFRATQQISRQTSVLAHTLQRSRLFHTLTPVLSEKEPVAIKGTKGHKPKDGVVLDSTKFHKEPIEKIRVLGKPSDPNYGERYIVLERSEAETSSGVSIHQDSLKREWKLDKKMGMYYQGKTLEEVSKQGQQRALDIDSEADDMVGYCSPAKK